MSSTLGSDFVFPSHYAYPPFYTLQPISSTRASQLLSWSSFILSYCRFYRLFTLNLTDALSSPLFQNTKLNRRLSAKDTRAVLDWMASKEGGETIEWIRDNNGDSGRESKCWVYWRRPEEWGSLVQEWVEETGQKGSVLTLYEIVEGDMTNNQGEALKVHRMISQC